MTKTIIFLLSALVIFSFSCKKKKDNACISYLTAPVIEAAGPSIGSVNQEIKFTVTFGIGSGCGQFFKFEESAIGNKTIVKVIAKFEGCICTAIYGEFKSDYIFKKSVTGTYRLEFNKGDGNFLIKEIIIQ